MKQNNCEDMEKFPQLIRECIDYWVWFDKIERIHDEFYREFWGEKIYCKDRWTVYKYNWRKLNNQQLNSPKIYNRGEIPYAELPKNYWYSGITIDEK